MCKIAGQNAKARKIIKKYVKSQDKMQKRRIFLENVLKSRKQRLVALKKGKIFKLLRYFVHFIIIFNFLFLFCHFLAISHFVPCDMGPTICQKPTWISPVSGVARKLKY